MFRRHVIGLQTIPVIVDFTFSSLISKAVVFEGRLSEAPVESWYQAPRSLYQQGVLVVAPLRRTQTRYSGGED
jgi:hypothetical protein